MRIINPDEHQYLHLLHNARWNGVEKPDRTSVGSSKALFGQTLTFDLSDNTFALLTHRRNSFKIVFEETMFFLRGESDTTKLSEKGITIWEDNTTREFLDGRGLSNLPVGDMGKGYSAQWRNFNGSSFPHEGKEPDGVDQLTDLLDGMKKDPYGRRHIITAWNPSQLHEMALPPCHIMQMYSITPDGKLHSSWVQRSADILFGIPYNIGMYCLLNHIFAKYLGLEAGTLTGFLQDAHVYKNQEVVVDELEDRVVSEFPKITINKDINTIDDILSLEFSDITIDGYTPDTTPITKVEMAV